MSNPVNVFIQKQSLTSKIVIGLFIVFLAGFFFKSCDSKENWEAKYNAYRDTVAVVLKESEERRRVADSAISFADSVLLKADSLAKRNAILIRKNKELSRVNDSTYDALIDSAGNPLSDSLQHYVNLNINQKKEIFGWRVIVDSLNFRLDLNQQIINSLTFANDSLNASNLSLINQLSNLPKPKSEKIAWIIPLPSRKTSFLIGVATGLATFIIADNLVK